MLTFNEALSRLLATAAPLGAERVSLEEASGRVLAEDVHAATPMPPFDYSAMDGYAVAAGDLEGGGPWELPVKGESAAGGTPPAFARGTACRILTGAALPEGADAVIPQEDVDRRDQTVMIRSAVTRGASVRRRGDDLAEGALALPRGARLHPGRIAMAAALDRPHLMVARRPVVSVLCSGDELRSPGEPGRAGSIPESNGYFVAAAARAAGAIVRIGPFVRDDREAATRAVVEALRGSDLVITVGGVSVGDHDVIRPALEAAGVTLDFWRVAIKPGKPLAVGRRGPTHVLGLPGNPASASLTFLLFGSPLLRALQGDAAPIPARIRAPVLGSLQRKAGREEFLRAQLEVTGGEIGARLALNQASGAVTSFAYADALVVVPEGRERVEHGERLEVILIAQV
jgi:molybdopterin molybdotransferase